jgi:hypothetical protein
LAGLRNKSKTERKVVSSKNRQIIVRSIPRSEPDYKKLAKTLIEVAIERQRQKNPASIKWYDERYPYRRQLLDDENSYSQDRSTYV